MIDLSNEAIISLREAAALIPPVRQGRPVSFNCILRWILKGSRKTVDGQIVKLEGLRVGSRWLTSRQALQRFAEALTPMTCDPQASPVRTPRQRRRAAELAERELEKMGI
jgi:hypothetical protein